MIEQAMVFALGFFIAGLIALVIAPAFWRRALRLTTRRIEMQIPLSAREILADRDLIRAEYAVERRRLEQKVASFGESRAKDMSELGRRAAIIVARQEELAALEKRNAEQRAELAALRRELAETSTELAASAVALHGASGLVERRDAALLELRGELSAARALADQRRDASAALEVDAALLRQRLAGEIAEVARRDQKIASMRLEREADLATLKAAAAKLADREEALEAAANRELDLQRARKLQIETTRAVERRLLDKVDDLRAAEAASGAALEAARENCDRLAREVAELRSAAPARGLAPGSPEQDENAILRRNIADIGAAVIRMASEFGALAPESASRAEDSAADAPATHVFRVLPKSGSGGAE